MREEEARLQTVDEDGETRMATEKTLEEAADTEAVRSILHATMHLLHQPQRPAVPPPRHCLFKDI